MANEYWLDDAAWAAVESLIPLHRRGVKPAHNRRVISGILHVLKFGCRWRDCPALYGPHTTIYNRFNRWLRAGIWQMMFDRLVRLDHADIQSIDSTTSKARRCVPAEKGPEAQAIGRSRGRRTTKLHVVADTAGRLISFDLSPGQMGPARWAMSASPLGCWSRCHPPPTLGDTAYDSNPLRHFLSERGSVPVIKSNPTRKAMPPLDAARYKSRNLIERAFSHLKDWHRVATRYDKLARNFRATVTLDAIFIW